MILPPADNFSKHGTHRRQSPPEFAVRRQSWIGITSESQVAEWSSKRRTDITKWGEPFQILIELGVPGEEIVVKHAPSLQRALAYTDNHKWVKHLEAGAPHKEIYVTIHDAFKAARRRLEDCVRRLRGEVKIHARVPPVRADKLRSETLAGL